MQRQRRARYDLSLCPLPPRSAPRARLLLTFLAGTLLAIAAHAGAAMTLDERIACREKIEDVYWAHRLWPKENQGQKPARETVAPHATVAARVEESLRYETAIGELWQEALSPQVIQAEMDREARATRDPAMLRELWAALDNEPSRVAECLVRPELAERRIKERYANDPSRHGAIRQRAALEIAASATVKVSFERWWSTRRQTTRPASPPAASYVLPAVIAGGCLYDNWTTSPGLSSTTPRARDFHTAVWTGSEMIVWGGFDVDSATSFNTGGRYTPATDTWVATSTVGAPSDRSLHTAVWTGSQMIVWGGLGSRGILNTGGRYTPAADTAARAATDGAGQGRDSRRPDRRRRSGRGRTLKRPPPRVRPALHHGLAGDLPAASGLDARWKRPDAISEPRSWLTLDTRRPRRAVPLPGSRVSGL